MEDITYYSTCCVCTVNYCVFIMCVAHLFAWGNEILTFVWQQVNNHFVVNESDRLILIITAVSVTLLHSPSQRVGRVNV